MKKIIEWQIGKCERTNRDIRLRWEGDPSDAIVKLIRFDPYDKEKQTWVRMNVGEAQRLHAALADLLDRHSKTEAMYLEIEDDWQTAEDQDDGDPFSSD